MFYDDFKDRKACLYVTGKPNTGKSVLCYCIAAIYPSWFVFSPSWDDTFPFSTVEPHHKCFLFQDMR